MLKITEAPALIHAGLYHLELDGRQVGTVNVFSGCLDAIRAALEETPEAAYLLEEQGREIATLVKRLANAELLIEKLKEEVGHWEEDFAMFDRAHEKAIDLWRKEHPDAGYTPDMSGLNEWMVGRVERAEAVKESLTSALGQFVEAYHKGLIGAVPDVPPAFVMNNHGYPQSLFITRNLLEAMVREAEYALRAAEESYAIDNPPAFGMTDHEDCCLENCVKRWNQEVEE